MPSLIGSLDAQIATSKTEKGSKTDADQIAREAEEEQTYARLDRLMMNEDWKWFQESFLKGFIEGKDSEHDKALKLSFTPEVRNNHAQRFDIAQEIIGLVKRERDKLFTRIQTRGQKAKP